MLTCNPTGREILIFFWWTGDQGHLAMRAMDKFGCSLLFSVLLQYSCIAALLSREVLSCSVNRRSWDRVVLTRNPLWREILLFFGYFFFLWIGDQGYVARWGQDASHGQDRLPLPEGRVLPRPALATRPAGAFYHIYSIYIYRERERWIDR